MLGTNLIGKTHTPTEEQKQPSVSRRRLEMRMQKELTYGL
jgi:hypothetical protein